MLIPATATHDSIYWFFLREVAIRDQGDTRDGWVDILKEVVRKTDVVKFYPNFKPPAGGR